MSFAERDAWPDAACIGRLAEMTMPNLDRPGGRRRGGGSYTRRHIERINAAKAICAGCPVLAVCRAWACSRPDPCNVLVAGGLTPAERSAGGAWMTDGTLRPDYGPGWRHRTCATCSATWVGHVRDGDWCPWCETAEATQRALQRRLLLEPPQLRSDTGSERYDALSDVDKAVWDRTRGQRRGADSVLAWMGRLARAVEAGLIDEGEAQGAMRRVAR